MSKWRYDYHRGYAAKIAIAVKLHGVGNRRRLWDFMLTCCPGMTWEEKEYVVAHGTHDHLWQRQRNGRTGYAAKTKGDSILVELWTDGKKQRHMEMSLPLDQWPIAASHDVPNLPLAHHEIALGMIVSMAKRVFNEGWGPHMDRQADEVQKAIYKVLP